MLKLKKISEAYGLQVYTDSGDYFGDVDEILFQDNKIYGWKIKATKTSFLAKAIGGAKGVIVPHPHVKALGDIMIISKSVIPAFEEEKTNAETDEEQPAQEK